MSSNNATDPNQLPKDTATSNTLANIPEVNVYDGEEQQRVMPRQLATGATRGQQRIDGLWVVTDKNGTVRLMMGYQQGAF